MEPFKPYQDKEKKGIRNLRVNELIRKLAGINRRVDIILFCLPVFFALLPFVWGYPGSILTGISLGLLLVSLSALILKIVVTARIKKQYKKLMKKLKEKVPDFYLQSIKKLKIGELSLRRIEPLVMDRLNSVVKLTSTVFLKIVRRLNYSRLYEDESYEYRRVSNLIMEMTEQDYSEKLERAAGKKSPGSKATGKILQKGPYIQEIGPEIKKVAEEAAGFGTTLWFTEKDKLEDMLDKLIATGQFTMCHNMLEYLEKLMFDDANDHSTLDNKVKKDLEQLHAQCANDWREFKKTPMFLVKEMKEKKI
jgi:hypothetical protein